MATFDFLDPEVKHADAKDRLAIANEHKQLSTLLASSDHKQAEHIIFLAAESAKDVESRTILAESEIFQPLADLLSHPDSPDTLKLQVFYILFTKNRSCALLGMRTIE
jgi:hypothetical protein